MRKFKIYLIVSTLLLSLVGCAQDQSNKPDKLYDEGNALMRKIESGLRAGEYKKNKMTQSKEEEILAIEKKYKEAIELWPKHGRAHIMLGMLYKFVERYEDAIPHLEVGMTLPKGSKDWGIAADTLGSVYMAMNDTKSGAKIFEEVVQVTPNDSLAYYKLGVCYAVIPNMKKAKEAFDKVIQLNDTHVDSAKAMIKQFKLESL